jgi:hypothetical protein
VDLWKVGIAQNAIYEIKMKLYVEYWEDILLHLSRPLPRQSATLLEGFWPSSNWRSNYSKASLSIVVINVDLEDPIQHLYCGPKNMRPSTVYTLFKDFNDGDFVFIKLHDHDLVPIWMGKTQGDVVKNEESAFLKMVKVQWWVPMKKGKKLDKQHLYEDCWNGKWKCNFADLEQWLDISCIYFLFPTQKKSNKIKFFILFAYANRAKINFDVTNSSNDM